MSYHKKSVILQELEQAIRKKAQEKSRNKETMGYLLTYLVVIYKVQLKRKKSWWEVGIKKIIVWGLSIETKTYKEEINLPKNIYHYLTTIN